MLRSFKIFNSHTELRRVSGPGGSIKFWKKQSVVRGFPSNKIKTSKYSKWNFLPKNLLE